MPELIPGEHPRRLQVLLGLDLFCTTQRETFQNTLQSCHPFSEIRLSLLQGYKTEVYVPFRRQDKTSQGNTYTDYPNQLNAHFKTSRHKGVLVVLK